jgi:ADP-ribose diphosphatase
LSTFAKHPPPRPKARDDVQLLDAQTIGSSYGRLFKYALRYRRFDGDWTERVERDCFDSGPAVIVLPYDPHKDEVVLIKQFRTGPWLAGADPWLYEVPAGRIDKAGAGAEETARSEAREEAGLTLTALERIAGFFTSPGIFSEHVDAFCGRLDGGARTGTFGLAEEHEDIWAEIFSTDQAIAMASSGAIVSGPTLVALLWLALNRDRLRAAWR